MCNHLLLLKKLSGIKPLQVGVVVVLKKEKSSKSDISTKEGR